MGDKGQTNKLEILLKIFVVVVVLLALFFNGKGIPFVTGLFTNIFISITFSIIAAAFVSAIIGTFLDEYTYEIAGIEFNIPTFILTLLVKFILFP